VLVYLKVTLVVLEGCLVGPLSLLEVSALLV
jgi:hypothetical protein